MGDDKEKKTSSDLANCIALKLESIAKLKKELENKKKLSMKRDVDEQIALAELEYRVVGEEVELLALQERHWQEAAHPKEHQQKEKNIECVLHEYIDSIHEQGVVLALHASDILDEPENLLLLSSSSGPLPRVEWAHPDTHIHAGDRLLEINGEWVAGQEASEVSGLLKGGPCRVVAARPHRPQPGGREASRLRSELSAVVSRLNASVAEKGALATLNGRLKKDLDDFRGKNQKLQLQVISLQSILLYLYRALQIKQQDTLPAECPISADFLKKTDWTLLTDKEELPWMDINSELSQKAVDAISSDQSEHL